MLTETSYLPYSTKYFSPHVAVLEYLFLTYINCLLCFPKALTFQLSWSEQKQNARTARRIVPLAYL